MKASETREVAVTIHLRIPDMLPDAVVERLSMQLVTYAADMNHVIEAGVGTPTPVPEPESPVSHDPCVQGTIEIAGVKSEFLIPLADDSVRYSQWGADNLVLWPRVDLLDAMAGAGREWALDNIRGDEDEEDSDA